MRERKLYKIGNLTGLNKKEMKEVLRNISNREEQTPLSVGVPCGVYPGGWYGTVSIYDF